MLYLSIRNEFVVYCPFNRYIEPFILKNALLNALLSVSLILNQKQKRGCSHGMEYRKAEKESKSNS